MLIKPALSLQALLLRDIPFQEKNTSEIKAELGTQKLQRGNYEVCFMWDIN